MKKRWIALLLCALTLLLAACGGAGSPESYDMEQSFSGAAPAPMASAAPQAAATEAYYPEEPMMDMVEAESGGAGWDGGTGRASDSNSSFGGHKIIRSANMSIETREFDANLAYIHQRTNELGGYVGSSHTSGRKPEKHGDSGRYANITLRIPQENMDTFLADARGLATVTSEYSSSDDITSSYFDTESRLEIHETQRERILELLAKAESMEAIIALETELSRLTYEIESLTTQLKRWDDLVSFASVSLDLTEIPPAMPTVTNDDSMGTRISEGFQGTLGGIAVFFEDLLVFLIAASPVLLILAIIALIVLFFIRRARRKRKAEQAQIEANRPSNVKDANNAPKVQYGTHKKTETVTETVNESKAETPENGEKDEK